MIGRIYRIVHLESEICYIGSTCNELRHRWAMHKKKYVAWKVNRKGNGITIYPFFDEHGINQYKMILIKEYEVVDRTQLTAYEQLWINKFNKSCVNKINPFKMHGLLCRADKWKEYRANNLEKIHDTDRGRYPKERERRIVQAKEYYQANKDKIRQRQMQKFNCDCGGKYQSSSKKKHESTKLHTDWLSRAQA